MTFAGSGTEIVRILLVDSDVAAGPLLSIGIRPVLRQIPVIMQVASGVEALEQLRAGTVDVILLDLPSLRDLSEDTEIAVARVVRLCPAALVIAISDGASVSRAMAAMRAGAHDHLSRPLGGLAFAGRVQEIAARHGKSRVLTIDGGGEAERPAESQGEPETPASAGRTAVLPMWRQEQRIIEEAIESFGGNIALAAQALELSPSTIYRKRQAWAEMEGKRGAA
ncbi:MAG: helix-turn-helix domain-containing protein [Devosia sp.]